MGRLSKAQVSRKTKGKKSGRGKRKSLEPPITTPFRPKTTLWRLRTKAAHAQNALYIAALANIQLSIPDRLFNRSRPSTAGNQSFSISRPSTGYRSIEALAGSICSILSSAGNTIDDRPGSSDRELAFAIEELTLENTNLIEEQEEENLDFEDIEEGEFIEEQEHIEVGNSFKNAVEQWPRIGSIALKKQILEAGIKDIRKLLHSKASPTGHDRTWHLQVLQFMNWQIFIITQKLKAAISPPSIKHKIKTTLSRKKCAMNVAIGYRMGQRVQERILKQEKMWIQNRKIPLSRQGKNAKMICMLEDEGTMMVVQECIASAGQNFRAHMLATAVSTYWQSTQPQIDQTHELQTSFKRLQLFSDSLQEVEQYNEAPLPYRKKLSLSATTALDWLHRMGYNWKEIKKGVYKDGHERPDVVLYRQNVFLKRLKELEPFMPYPIENEDGEVEVELPQIPIGAHFIIPVTHDECTCNANDGPHYQWIKDDNVPLRSKSRGQGLHISEFITPWGRLSIGEEEMSDIELLQAGFLKRTATEIIQCGGDIWWDQEQIVKQTMTAISIFEAAYPGCQALFLFDNATSHSAFAENALRASKMNKGSGGAQAQLRDGYYYDKHDTKIVQSMSYPGGKPKGLQVILEERGLWPKEGLFLDCSQRQNLPKEQRKHSEHGQCCARQLMSLQPDFQLQKGRIQELVEAKGHLILFYPRFHCELNWIEYFWGRVKLYTRTHCCYDIKSLKENVPKALDWASDLIPKWWRKSLRIMDTYRDGVVYGTEAFKIRAYRSHRRVFVGSKSNV